MAGTYFAARDATQPLFFEGRLLYGCASNYIDALVIVLDGQSQDPWRASFDSERWQVQARVEGMYRLGVGATLIPLADLSHARDEMEPFLAGDDSDALIDGQTIALTNLPIGAELEFPVETARGEVLFRPGLRFVASDSSGGAFAGEAGEEAGPRSCGRIDFRDRLHAGRRPRSRFRQILLLFEPEGSRDLRRGTRSAVGVVVRRRPSSRDE